MATPDQEKLIKDYFDAVIASFQQKTEAFCKDPAITAENRLQRVTALKDGLKNMEVSKAIGFAAGDYSHCPSGNCVGGVCVDTQFGDRELAALAQALNLPA